MLIAFEDLGTVQTKVELFTDDLYAEYFIFSAKKNKKFQKTNNLQQLAKDMGMAKFSEYLPKTTAHYLITKIALHKPGASHFQLKIYSNDSSIQFNDIFYIEMLAYRPKGSCEPKVTQNFW